MGLAGIAFGLLLISACARTSVWSQTDPQLVGRTFHRILVIVNFSDLGLRQDTERQFRAALVPRGVEVIPSAELLFPGRNYSVEELKKILADARIEAVLVIAAAGAGTKASWVPQTSTTQAYAVSGGNAVSGQSTTQTYGGHYIGKPWAQYDAALHDINSGAVVWIARMSSEGNAFAGWDDLARSMAKKTSEQLLRDRILR